MLHRVDRSRVVHSKTGLPSTPLQILTFGLRNVFSRKIQAKEICLFKKKVVKMETSHLFLNCVSGITDLQSTLKWNVTDFSFAFSHSTKPGAMAIVIPSALRRCHKFPVEESVFTFVLAFPSHIHKALIREAGQTSSEMGLGPGTALLQRCNACTRTYLSSATKLTETVWG